MMQRAPEIRIPHGSSLLQTVDHSSQMSWAATWWELFLDAVRKRHKPHQVLLVEHDIGQRSRQIAGIIELTDAVRSVVHRGTGVDQEVTTEVGLLLILFDVITVKLGIGLPVDVADLISWHILAMLGELDAEAFIGARMEPRDESFHHIPSTQQESREFGERQRIEITRFIRHQGRSGWISASKRSMICKE